MSTDAVLTAAQAVWSWLAGLPAADIFSWAVPAVLILFILVSLRANRPDRRISTLATVIGLAWSAQGMFDVAVREYKVAVPLAAILFLLFECFLIANMQRAQFYRSDLRRRAKPVQFVWGIAVVMGVVVAFGEGWAQAPLRLSVPLLVAINWHIALTADDDPGKKVQTSLRWTPRRLGLAIGMLERRATDAETVDRDHLRDRMTLLAFRIQTSPDWLNTALRRTYRLNLAETTAEDADIAEVRSRLSRTGRVLADPPKTPPPPPPPPAPPGLSTFTPAPLVGAVPIPSRRRPGNVTKAIVDGKLLVDDELRDHFVRRLYDSVSETSRKGMTTQELIDSYGGQIGTTVAQQWAAAARKELPTNGAKLTP